MKTIFLSFVCLSTKNTTFDICERLKPITLRPLNTFVTRRVIWALDDVRITYNARLLMFLCQILSRTVSYSLLLDTRRRLSAGTDCLLDCILSSLSS